MKKIAATIILTIKNGGDFLVRVKINKGNSNKNS